jgi:hypothetical protein
VPTDNVASEYPRESKGGMFKEERVGAERRPNERRKRGDCLLLLWLLPPPSWADGAVEEANMMPAAEVQGIDIRPRRSCGVGSGFFSARIDSNGSKQRPQLLKECTPAVSNKCRSTNFA